MTLSVPYNHLNKWLIILILILTSEKTFLGNGHGESFSEPELTWGFSLLFPDLWTLQSILSAAVVSPRLLRLLLWDFLICAHTGRLDWWTDTGENPRDALSVGGLDLLLGCVLLSPTQSWSSGSALAGTSDEGVELWEEEKKRSHVLSEPLHRFMKVGILRFLYWFWSCLPEGSRLKPGFCVLQRWFSLNAARSP